MALDGRMDDGVDDPSTFTAKVPGAGVVELNTVTYAGRSTFFANALSAFPLTNPPSTAADAIEVPDIDGETFGYYLRCVETGDATICQDATGKVTLVPDSEDSAEEAHIDSIMKKYCLGYYFATKMGDAVTANLIVDTLIDFSFDSNHMLCDVNVNWIIEALSHESGLYKLAVDMWAFAAKYENFHDRSAFGYLPHSFGKDVWIAEMKAEARGHGKLVEEAFSHDFIRIEKGKYHGFNGLDQKEGEWDEDDAADGISEEENCMDQEGDEGIAASDEEVEVPVSEDGVDDDDNADGGSSEEGSSGAVASSDVA